MDGKAAILDATERALCEQGYADLTMQDIADETGMTTAAIHYHFDTKEELLNAFLDDLLARVEDQIACDASDPGERLAAFLDAVFTPAEGDDGLPVALLELKAQAPYHETYRERFADLDASIRAVVAETVREGVDAGQFAQADPDAVARFVATALNGSYVRTVALDEDPAATRQVVESYLERRLDWTPGVLA